jgi:periplasmic divalent cation tolerance protein
MEKTKYVVVFVTCANKEEGEKISQSLVEKKLVACVNLIPEIFSHYWWQGKIESSSEVLLLMKTKKSLVNKLIAEVKKLHSYTVPEIIALPIIEGNSDYLDWIKESVIE